MDAEASRTFGAIVSFVSETIGEGVPLLHLTILGPLLLHFTGAPFRDRILPQAAPQLPAPTHDDMLTHLLEVLDRAVAPRNTRPPPSQTRSEENQVNRPHRLLILATAIVAACRSQPVSPNIVAAGHVEATDVRISAKVGGRLLEAPLKEGDAVKAGAPIARLSTTDVEIAVRQANADHAQAIAELQLRLAGARKEDLAEMEAQIRATEADLSGAQLDLDRMQGLLERGSGTTKSRDDALTRQAILSARLGAQQQSLARLRSGSRPQEIDAARARVESALARIAQLQQQISDARMTSPVDGVLTSRLAEPGEQLQVGSPICVITRLSEAWLTVYITDLDLARIRIGQEALVTTDGGQTRKGRLTFIASKAEFTPKNVQTRDERVKLVYRVKVGLDNADGFFKPGMPAEATFEPVASPR